MRSRPYLTLAEKKGCRLICSAFFHGTEVASDTESYVAFNRAVREAVRRINANKSAYMRYFIDYHKAKNPEIGTLKAFHTAGFLGTEHGPFLIVDPQDAAFLAALGNAGITVPDPGQAIASAQAVCGLMRNGETGLQVLTDVRNQIQVAA